MRWLLGPAALAVAATAPGLAVAPLYAEPDLVAWLLAGWAVTAVLVTAALDRWLTAPAVLVSGFGVAFGGVAALAAALPGPVPEPVPGAVDAVAHSGARILTTTMPLPVAVDALALPALMVWLAGAAATLALRGGHPLAALLCPLLALAGMAVLNGPDVQPAYLPAALFALAAVVVLALPAPADRPSDGGGVRVSAVTAGRRFGEVPSRALGLGFLLALVAVLTTYIGPLALYGSGINPADPREEVTPPEEDVTGVNPLSYLGQWAAEPDERLLMVESAEPTDLRWVTLADFDGVTWLPEGRYQAAGPDLPAPDTVVLPGPLRTATVQVTDLPGHWLPVVGVPRRVTGVAIGFDPESATVRAQDSAAAGAEYTVTGQLPEWDEDVLGSAASADPTAFERYLHLPEDPPEQIGAIASAFCDGSPYERANRLAAHLRDNYGFNPEAPGGHGYANLDEFLVPPDERGAGGTSEQFASAFALLARACGVPSRVVVGFGPGTPAGAGRQEVRTGDAVAWGEVHLDGVGWAPFDVTPGEPKDNGGAEESGAGGDEEMGDLDVDGHGADVEPIQADETPLDVGQAWATVGWTALGLLAALVAAALAVGAVRAVRRQLRLRSAGPSRRVLGAWRELRDGLRLAGAGPTAADTVSDVLARADAALPAPDGGRRDWVLGATLNAMAFRPVGVDGADGPGRVGTGTAERAAGEVRSFTAALRRHAPRTRRLLWWLDPRPLWWRH